MAYFEHIRIELAGDFSITLAGGRLVFKRDARKNGEAAFVSGRLFVGFVIFGLR